MLEDKFIACQEEIRKNDENTQIYNPIYVVDHFKGFDWQNFDNQYEEGETNEDGLDRIHRCVRNTVAFENKNCEKNTGLIDPQICYNYQLKKIKFEQENVEDDNDWKEYLGKYEDFNSWNYIGRNADWKQQKIWEKINQNKQEAFQRIG